MSISNKDERKRESLLVEDESKVSLLQGTIDRSLENNNDENEIQQNAQDDQTSSNQLKTSRRSPFDMKLKQRSKAMKRAQFISSLGWELVKHTGRTIKRSKMNFCLGSCAVLIVVVVVAVLLTTLSNSPLVFLRLAELQQSEIDMEIWSTNTRSLNLTTISNLLEHRLDESYADDAFTYSSPRRESSITLRTDCSGKACMGVGIGASLYWINFERETRMGLGREWTKENPGPGEIYISSSLSTSLGASAGSTIWISFSPFDMFYPEWSDTFAKGNWDSYDIPLKVKGVVSGYAGKLSNSDTSRACMMEFNDAFSWLANYVADVNLKQKLRSMNHSEYAQSIVFNLPPASRLSYYLTDDYDSIQKTVVAWANAIMYRIGFPSVNMNMGILSYLAGIKYLTLFLALIINVIIFILLFISIVLIYSLLITNVETRTFEIGVFRMFGMERLQVISMLILHALSYSAVAFPLGMMTALIISLFLTTSLGSLIGLYIEPWLSGQSVGVAILFGILMPMVASVFPIRSALGTNLQDSLDTRASKTKAVAVQMERSEGNSFSFSSLLLGTMMSIFGLSIYYGLPLALISLNLQLLLYIFIGLILAMLFGLTLLSVNFETMLEELFLLVFFFWDYASVRSIVSKNFVAHRLRNRKTFILFSVSLAFIVFISVSAEIQVNEFLYQQQQRAGVLMYVQASGYSNTLAPQNLNSISADLESWAETSPYVVNYGWASRELLALSAFASTSYSNIGRIFKYSTSMFALSPNVFDISIQEPNYLYVTSYSGTLNLAPFLYSVAGSHSLIMGTTFQTLMGLSEGDHFLLQTQSIQQNRQQQQSTQSTTQIATFTRLSVGAFVSLAPAFYFSKFPQITRQDSLISFPSYVRLSLGAVPNADQIPLQRFLIQFTDDITSSQLDQVKRELNNMARFASGASVWDYRTLQTPLQTTEKVLSYFFNFATGVAMMVCFFSLSSSMYTNIFEQTKEIGILRAIGISKFSVYRIYIYEAMCLILASSVSGVAIGAFVSYTMILQRILFTQLPIPFVLPYNILLVVSGCSVVFAVSASWGPISFLLRQKIVTILRYVF